MRLYNKWIKLPCFKNLSFGARSLLIEILALYRPNNGPMIEISASLAGRLIARNKSTGNRLLGELIDQGWLVPECLAKFNGKKGKASIYRLTMYGTPDAPPTYDFLQIS